VLLVGYYVGRGLSLLALPSLLTPHTTPSTWVFILFYGLDWVATVPPTVALCRKYYGVSTGPIVFGWVFASHQVGAAFAAVAAGIVRDQLGNYDLAWYIAGILSCGAAVLSLLMLATRRRVTAPEPALAA
jgi:predicted MFS family arabinose efflux permease